MVSTMPALAHHPYRKTPSLCRPYLNKLPMSFSEDDKIVITDPMLATGGTIMQVTAHAPRLFCSHRVLSLLP